MEDLILDAKSGRWRFWHKYAHCKRPLRWITIKEESDKLSIFLTEKFIKLNCRMYHTVYINISSGALQHWILYLVSFYNSVKYIPTLTKM